MTNFLQLLQDVDINGLADGDMLVFEASTKRFRPSSQKVVNTAGDVTVGNLTVTTDALISGNETITGTLSSGNHTAIGGLLQAGKDAVAGLISIFAGTTAKGKVTLTTSDNTGNTTTNINVAAQAGARTLTIPDPGASSSFIMADGAQTINGVKTFAANSALFAGGTIGAAGSAQGNATAIIHNVEVVTGADGTKGVVLPAATVGNEITVKNNAAAILKVYPAGTDAINALGASNPISMANLTCADFVCGTAAQWFTKPLLPS